MENQNFDGLINVFTPVQIRVLMSKCEDVLEASPYLLQMLPNKYVSHGITLDLDSYVTICCCYLFLLYSFRIKSTFTILKVLEFVFVLMF